MNILDVFSPSKGNVQLNSSLLSQILGTGYPGNVWYVNETTGNDNFPGTALQPFATLAAAQNAAVANNADVVCLLGSVHQTATLNWAKNGVSLIALLAPSNNGRSRISCKGATPFSPLVNVTAEGCQFIGIGTFHGGFTTPTGSQVCWADAGGRNYYKNVQFLGGGDLVAAALAGMRSLTVGGDGENLFEDCTLGLDTIMRATNANATLELINGTARNIFRRCTLQSLVSDAADVHVKVGASGIDRYALFDACAFVNDVDSTGTAMSAAISADAAAGGSVILTPTCTVHGAGAVALSGPVYVSGASGAATTSSITVKTT